MAPSGYPAEHLRIGAADREFRAGPGAITDLAPLLSAPPSLTKGPVDGEV